MEWGVADSSRSSAVALTPTMMDNIKSTKLRETPTTPPQPRPESFVSEFESTAGSMVLSRFFEPCMNLVIVAHCITIALEQHFRLENRDVSAFKVCEHVFLTLYVIELGLRFVARNLDSWAFFDVVLVSSGVLFNWVLNPMLGATDRWPALVGRLLRLLRAARLTSQFQELWTAVQRNNILHLILLCGVLFFVFGCMSIELIPLAFQGQEDTLSDAAKDIIETNFRSLPVAMLTLVQFLTFDNVAGIYRPLVEANAALTVFFAAVILNIGVVFMNLVSAIVVSAVVEQVTRDREIDEGQQVVRQKKLLHGLREAFVDADANDSGHVGRTELQKLDAEDKALLNQILGVDLLLIFNSLDIENTGSLQIETLIRGIESVVLSRTSVEVKHIERMVESMYQHVKDSQKAQDELRQAVGQISTVVGANDSAEGEEQEEQEEEEEEEEEEEVEVVIADQQMLKDEGSPSRQSTAEPEPAREAAPRAALASGPSPGPEPGRGESVQVPSHLPEEAFLRLQEALVAELKHCLDEACCLYLHQPLQQQLHSLGGKPEHKFGLESEASQGAAMECEETQSRWTAPPEPVELTNPEGCHFPVPLPKPAQPRLLLNTFHQTAQPHHDQLRHQQL